MAVLIDTSFFIAFINTRDRNHHRSRALAPDIFSGKYGQIIITDHIYDETITTCLHRINNESDIEKLGDYMLNSEIELFQIDKQIFLDTRALFKQYHHSFTDCISAAFSKKYKIEYIATFDAHFDTFNWLKRIC